MGGVIRGIFGYCFLVFIVRIVGRRPGKQMSPFDFVLVFFMGGVTLTPMVGNDRSITNALCTILSIALAHWLLSWLKSKSRTAGRIIDGTPLILMEKGRWHTHTLEKMRLLPEDVMGMARDQGLQNLDQISYATLERNGEISIIPSGEES